MSKNEQTEWQELGYTSAARCILDRDYPMSESALVEWFFEMEGRKPTPEETGIMRPDSSEQCEAEEGFLCE